MPKIVVCETVDTVTTEVVNAAGLTQTSKSSVQATDQSQCDY